jgi:DNA-binding response OmpR family regulator/anti-anti-sigma regulatory factor
MGSDTARFQLLLVDDSPANLEILFNALAGEGFDILTANDGEKALEIAREEPPDLVLLDLVMPGIDGLEVCKRLKADTATRDTAVLVMTAHDELQHRIQAFDVGAVDFIRRPFDTPELLARVRTQLSIRTLTKALKEQNAALEREIRERERLMQELREAKEQLERELDERKRLEVERGALQERIIAVQRERLLELSTPLIPVTPRIMVMPLIGTMDVERMQRVTETALHGAHARGAEFVILDITGVKGVDASVAFMLVQVDAGLRLLGARAVITGIGQDVARTLVTLDASLRSLVTKGTLHDGITYALHTRSASARS